MSSFISDSKKRKTNMTSLKSQPKRIKKSATNYNYNNISFLVVHHLRKQQIPSNNYIKFTLSENLKNYREIQRRKHFKNDLLRYTLQWRMPLRQVVTTTDVITNVKTKPNEATTKPNNNNNNNNNKFCLFKKLLFTMENAAAAGSSQSNISRLYF